MTSIEKPVEPRPTFTPPASQSYTPEVAPSRPINNKPSLPTVKSSMGMPSRENLLKYVQYNEDSLVIGLLHNKEIAIVNKKSGDVNIYPFSELLNNEMLGYNREADLLRAFGKIATIMYEVNAIVLTDIRHVNRMFEQRKESPVTKQMIAYDNKKLYVALTSENAVINQTTIKNFAIESHKNAVANHERLKANLQAFAKDIYLILTLNNLGILVVADEGKKVHQLSIEEIYRVMPDVKNVGDIMRLFPIENIINGSYFDIENKDLVRSIMNVPSSTFTLSSAPFYTLKGVNFGYDPKSRIIIKANVVKD